MVVGRFIYSRGGSKIEVGVCSNFLTSVEPGKTIKHAYPCTLFAAKALTTTHTLCTK